MASVVDILERAFDEHKYNVFPSQLLADSAIAPFFAIVFLLILVYGRRKRSMSC